MTKRGAYVTQRHGDLLTITSDHLDPFPTVSPK